MFLFHNLLPKASRCSSRKQYIKIRLLPKWSKKTFCIKIRHCSAFCPYTDIIRILYYNRFCRRRMYSDIFSRRVSDALRALR